MTEAVSGGEHAELIRHAGTGADAPTVDEASAAPVESDFERATAVEQKDEAAHAVATSVYERELRIALRLARAAGAEALKFYGGPLKIRHKTENDDPVTQADYAANAVIVAGLEREFPADGLLSEETTDTVRRLSKPRVWVIDPIDGTKGFIEGNGDFAVQIGLAVEGRPALGVVYEPAADVLHWAARGAGAWVTRAGVTTRSRVSRQAEPARMRLAASRSHRSPRMDSVVRAFGFREEVRRGSVGIKIGLIVERQCDLYITLSSKTSQWDTCAPEAILREAGGRITDLWGEPLAYNTEDVRNYNGIAATNGACHERVTSTLAPLLAGFVRARV